MHDRQHVDREVAGPTLVVVRRAEGRGVVDQEIHAAQGGDGLAHIAAHGIALRKVGAGGMGLAAEPGDLDTGLLERLGVAGADRDVAAARREAQRDRLADAPAAAANDGLLAREIYLHHALSLMRYTTGRHRGGHHS